MDGLPERRDQHTILPHFRFKTRHPVAMYLVILPLPPCVSLTSAYFIPCVSSLFMISGKTRAYSATTLRYLPTAESTLQWVHLEKYLVLLRSRTVLEILITTLHESDIFQKTQSSFILVPFIANSGFHVLRMMSE